jgi:hypothetical protein
MRDRRLQLRSQAGQSGADFMGMLLLVALVIAAIVATNLHQHIATRTAELICQIAGDQCDGPGSGGDRADGKPSPAMCVTNSSSRGLAGAVKVFFVEIGGGVEAIKEVRADGTIKITIKGNAEAGLEFGSPGAEFEGGGVDADTPGGEVSVAATGEYGRAWIFKNDEDADEFVDKVKRKVTAIIDPTPNMPFTDDDADIELPEHDETTFAGGVEVDAKGSLGGGAFDGGLSGAAGIGAIYNQDEDSPFYGDKTYFFDISGGGEVSASSGPTESLVSLGLGADASVRLAITYDREGRPRKAMVIGQLDVTGSGSFALEDTSRDLDDLLSGLKKIKAGGTSSAGGRAIFTADLDLHDPANLAAFNAFKDGRDPVTGEPVSRWSAGADLFDRFNDDATLNARFYAVTNNDVSAGFDAGIFGIEGDYTSEDATLVDAFYRPPNGLGGFQEWKECEAQ